MADRIGAKHLSTYPMPTPSAVTTDGLVKQNLAERLLAEIMKGALPPGVRIVEGKWAQEFGVAQGSIREAIHILERDGFVTKELGRSARVVLLTEKDVIQLYELRGVIEGLAARLAAIARADLSGLQSIVDGMRRAAVAKNAGDLLDWDLRFHLELCKIARNPHLLEHAIRILTPFFAFVRLRMTASRQGTSVWDKDLESHQRIIDLLREGEGDVAEEYVKRAMIRFAKTAYDNWVSHGK
jgi:DNA-binding GntR family transcriptional regulator